MPPGSCCGLVAAYPRDPTLGTGEDTPSMVEWITAFQQQGGYVRGLKRASEGEQCVRRQMAARRLAGLIQTEEE